jgi:hypothetical protein
VKHFVRQLFPFQGIHVFMLGLNSERNASLTLNVQLTLSSGVVIEAIVMGAIHTSAMVQCLPRGLLSNLITDNLAKSHRAHHKKVFYHPALTLL